MTPPIRRPASAMSALNADDAFIALLIAAMDASGHVAADEAARAHNIIWSMRRFRHRSGERVGRRIDADHRIAAAVRQPFAHRREDPLHVVGGMVGLAAR